MALGSLKEQTPALRGLPGQREVGSGGLLLAYAEACTVAAETGIEALPVGAAHEGLHGGALPGGEVELLEDVAFGGVGMDCAPWVVAVSWRGSAGSAQGFR